jgi:hypothetical protein
MSITVACDTVVGIKFEKKDLFEIKTVKAFNHNYPETMKFCPETGKKLWSIDKWSAKFPGLERGDDRFAGLKLVNGPNVYKKNDESTYGFESDPETFYIGKSFQTNGYQDDKRVSLITEKALAESKAEVKEKLEPLGLWDEKNFGVWTVLYIG